MKPLQTEFRKNDFDHKLVKRCRECGEEKPFADFYPKPNMVGGCINKCKECSKKEFRERGRLKSADPKWKLLRREQNRLRTKSARAAGLIRPSSKEVTRKAKKLFKAKNPHKIRAGGMVHRAVKRGMLSRQPCEKCGRSDTHAHHDDYDKPLDVRWLCPPCHAAHHVAMREAVLMTSQNAPCTSAASIPATLTATTTNPRL